MAVYQIVKNGDEILRTKAKEVKTITRNIAKLLDNMKDTMYAAKGVGLAAPQIGISKRVIVVDVDGQYYELINPEILERAGEETDTEGCLSVPGIAGEVTRAATITIKGLDRAGKEQVIKAEGMLARAFQHETDHLDGILFIDLAHKTWNLE